jgi:hypothetical protein
MNKLLASVAFAALMATSGSAFAIDLGLASVAKALCFVPTGGVSPTLGFNIQADGTVLPGGPSTLLNVAGAYCTGPAKVSISSAHGAVTTGANGPVAAYPGGLFANHIKYSATASWDALNVAVSALNVAPSTVVSAANGGATSSTLLVQASTPGTGGLPLIAGTYSDTLTVQIIAQ